MEHDKTISVWFFIGALLLVYGVLILAYGAMHMGAPTPGVVLGELHVDTWWGALLLVIGGFYTFAFRPGKG
ncbi:MAG: hypothetical protein JSU00_01165 [Acidobacteria bacterium]|nr:hypothetical protein [Acidobacteriota bacterium]